MGVCYKNTLSLQNTSSDNNRFLRISLEGKQIGNSNLGFNLNDMSSEDKYNLFFKQNK
jgi:hypothetical protein